MARPGALRVSTRLLLARHGETDSNAEGRTLGRRDAPLNARGREQVQALALGMGAYAPVAVYSSPSSRARDTALAIAGVLELPVTFDERLYEFDQGHLDGLTMTELREQHADFLQRWSEDERADLRMPGGETMREVQTRMLDATTQFAAAHLDRDVVVVSHNLALQTLLCHALGVPLSATRHLRIDLASLNVVEVDTAGRWTLVTLNERCHLPEAGA